MAALAQRKTKGEHSFSFLSAALLCAAVFFLYRPVLGAWFEFVRLDQTYSYALLVPPVAFALALLEIRSLGWQRFLADAQGAGFFGYALIAAGCLMLFMGRETLLLFVMRLSFLVTLIGVTLAVLGWRNLRRLAFPLGFLLFAVPLPATIYLPLSGHLQLVSSALAGHALDLIGIPALREGNIIVLPNASLDVAQACSGIHSLFALTATATLAAYLLVEGRLPQILVALSAAPIAILFNGLRIVLTAVMCYAVGSEAAQGLTHMTTGLVVFVLGCAAIVGLCLLLSRRQRFESRANSSAANSRADGPQAEKRLLIGPGWNVVAAIAVVIFAFAVQDNVHLDRPIALKHPLTEFPLQLGKWHGQQVTISKRQLESLNPSAILTRVYAAQDSPAPIELYVAYYSRQESGATMHSPLHCIPGAGWEVDKTSLRNVPSGDGPKILANQMVFQKNDERMLVVYWYMQQGEPERSQLSGVMTTLWRSVFDRRSDGCLIRLSAPIIGSEKKTLSELMAFAGRAVPLLVQSYLPGPSDSKLFVASKR
jgi:exosortase D (VPLPA-CTERM-specific)